MSCLISDVDDEEDESPSRRSTEVDYRGIETNGVLRSLFRCDRC